MQLESNYNDFQWWIYISICISSRIYASANQTTIGLNNGSSPGRRQAIIWTNAGILSIGPLGLYFNEISMEIQTFSFRKMRLKSSSAKWWPSCLGLNVLSGIVSILSNRHCYNHQIYSSMALSPHDSIGMHLWCQSIHSLVVPSRGWFQANYWLSAGMEAVATNISRMNVAWPQRHPPDAC